jgi:head-tail adaptor
MRAGNLIHTVKFYSKVSTRDSYNASVDTYPIATITTRGEIRYSGGGKVISNEEKQFTKTMDLSIRYNSEVVETMRVQIDNKTDLFSITYIEEIGRKEGLRISLEKLSDGLPEDPLDPPTAFSVIFDGVDHNVISFTANDDDDPVAVERSLDGNNWFQIFKLPKLITEISDYDIEVETRYFYRIRSYKYQVYSVYTEVFVITTEIEDI